MSLIPSPLRLPLLVLAAGMVLMGCDKSRPAYALTSTNTIIKFETNTPKDIESESSVGGLAAGESLLQIDFRPADKTMYGLVQSTTTSDTCATAPCYYIASVNPDSGTVTKLGAAFTPPSALVAPIAMDIDPQNDYVRVVDYAGSTTGTSNNFSVSFSGTSPTVTSRQSTANPALYFNDNDTNSGEVPQLVALAHSNDVPAASGTTLYGLDVTTQSLVTVSTSGQLKTVANCGHAFISGNASLDIVPDGDQGFAALGSAGVNAVFYKVNLSNCNLNQVDEIGGSRQIRSLAVTLEDTNKNN